MKVLTILGGPRKRGNTATILSAFESLAAERHEVDRIDITDYVVKGCLGCEGCRPSENEAGVSRNGRPLDEPGCAQHDDCVRILECILASDLTVYACPVYSWSFPAQFKALIDRHYCLVRTQPDGLVTSLMARKRAALLVTCAGSGAENADLIEVMFRRQIDYCRGDYAGAYVVDNCSTPQELGDRVGDVSRRMAKELLGS